MKIEKTKIEGVYTIESDVFSDERGTFVKYFNKDIFEKNSLVINFEENFYSISNKNVIRGMHFQKSSKAMAKVVYVTQGAILDVVLDIRKNSPTYGQYFSIEISADNHTAVYIPQGCAHGFLSLEDGSCTIYLQEKVYAPEYEDGINPNSFGMNWEISNPIISQKDQNLTIFQDFNSPFV